MRLHSILHQSIEIMRCRIEKIIQHSPLVKEFCLAPADGQSTTEWNPGSHLELQFQTKSGTRFENSYSLVGKPSDLYRIAVQREEGGRGGSKTLHDEFLEGMEIEASPPIDSFAFHIGQARNVLIAGGIGITPMISMALALESAKARFEFHYLARDISRLVLLGELQGLTHGQIITHVTSDTRPDLKKIIGPYIEGSELHACGPISLLEAIRANAEALSWPIQHLHFESFGSRAAPTDEPLRVHLSLSDMTLDVMPGTPILEAMITADAFVAYECKRGECGSCFARVLSGTPLHRDVCLTPEQRAEGMTTCVSWATGPDLVLEL